MAGTHSATQAIRNPGPWVISGGMQALFAVLAIAGFAIFFINMGPNPDRAWSAFVLNHFFFLSLALGGLFFAAVQWVSSAMWSAPVRRLSEAFTSYLPVVAITFLILVYGAHHLYTWTNAQVVAGDHTLQGKQNYLNLPFFIARGLVAVAVWVFYARKLVGSSIRQDTEGGARISNSNRSWSPSFLLVFTITFTLVSFDQMMSLDAHWFSTMFGVYMFAGLFYANLASTCVLTLLAKRAGKLDGIVNDNHIHDLGKFMFAFTIFWAYIAFAQFMLIWYANMPEETGYFIRRFQDGWLPVSIFLIAGKFCVPFFLLLPRDAKRNEPLLLGVAIFMLVAQWIDNMWVVQPELFHDGPKFGWIELGTTIGFFGVFALLVSRFLSKNNIVAIGDPRLAESVYHHHQ